MRHAARECSIHKQLQHASVVRLIDVFEVDADSFCTVRPGRYTLQYTTRSNPLYHKKLRGQIGTPS